MAHMRAGGGLCSAFEISPAALSPALVSTRLVASFLRPVPVHSRDKCRIFVKARRGTSSQHDGMYLSRIPLPRLCRCTSTSASASASYSVRSPGAPVLERCGLANGCRRKGASATSGRRRQRRGPKAREDDFDVDDDGFDVQVLADDELEENEEDEEEDLRDYDAEYETPIEFAPIQQTETETSFVNTEEEVEETVVSWKINEDEFHKISLLTCDFFIRKVPDPDDDVFDFREMYVTPPDTDTYSIPRVECVLPRKPVRCTWSNYEHIHTTEPPVDQRRSPLAKTDYEVMKVFLMKHLKDRRRGHEQFHLDFEEIYVIDSLTKTFSKADVKVKVPGGKNRSRQGEVLIVRKDGTEFSIIPEEKRLSPDQIVQQAEWNQTREEMENYLRGFRDYDISNWF